jgi:hypothetical protein
MSTGARPLDLPGGHMPVSQEQERCQRRSTRAIDDQPAARAPPEGDSLRGYRCTRVDIERPVGGSVTQIKGESRRAKAHLCNPAHRRVGLHGRAPQVRLAPRCRALVGQPGIGRQETTATRFVREACPRK